MPSADEIREVFVANGIDMDSLEQKMESAISSGQYTEDEIKNAILQQYNSLASKQNQANNQQVPTQGQQGINRVGETPNTAKGTLQAIYEGMTGGLAPYIEGAKATNIGKIAYGVINPVAGIANPPSAKAPLFDKNAYEQAKNQFVEERKAFGDAHPILDTAGKIVGTVGGIALTAPIGGVAGAGAKAVGLGKGAQAIARSAAQFGAYGAERGLANEGKGLSLIGAGSEGLQEAALGAVFPVLGGGAAKLETYLEGTKIVKSAMEMSGLIKYPTQAAVTTVGAFAEGAAVATSAAGIEKAFGEERSIIPSAGEVLGAGAFITGVRGVGKGVQETASLLNQLKNPTLRENAANTINSINKAISRLEVKIKEIGEPTTEQQAANKRNYEKQIEELKSQLEPVVKAYQEDIARIAEQEGWTPVKKGDISKTQSGYSVFEKNGKTVELRVSNHRASNREGVVTIDTKQPYDQNILNVQNTLRQIERLEDGAKFPKKIGEFPVVQEKVSPTEAQIEDLKLQEQKKTGGEIGDKMASAILKQRNIDLSFEKAKKASAKLLPLGERLRRITGKTLRKMGEVTDAYIPLDRTTKTVEDLPGGKETPMSERPGYITRQRDRGGKVAVRQKPIVDDLEKEIKADPLFMEKWQQYAVAKKNEEMLPGVIKRLEKGNKKGDNNNAIANKKRELEEAKALVKETEELHPNVVKHAEKHWEYAQEQLDELLASGRISKQIYSEWKNRKHYIHSVAKLPENDIPGLLSSEEVEAIDRQSGIADALKRYTGFEGGYENLALGNLVQGKRISYFADTQRAMKAWLKDALKTGEARKLEPGEYFKAGEHPVIKKDSQIIAWNNGVPEVYEVPKNVARIFNPTIKEEGFLLKNLRLTNNVFKMGTTGISTGFSAMNLIRDFQSVIGGSRSGMYFRPAYLKTSAELYGPNADKNLTPSQKELRDLIDEGLGPEYSLSQTQMDLDRSELNRLNTMLEAQGKANTQGTFIGDAMALLMKGVSMAKAPAEKTFQKVANGLSFLGNYSEKIGRATVFQTELRRLAGSEERFEYWMANPKDRIPKNDLAKAKKEMTEVTLDFHRKMHPVIESLNKYALPYFKPSLLGAERVWKVLTDPEIAPQAWNWLGGIAAMQGLIRAEMDENQKKKYESQFNPEINAKNLSIVSKNGTITTIPASQEFGGIYQWLAAGMEHLIRSIKGKEQREGVKNEIIAAASQLAQNAIPGGYLLEPSNLAPTPVGKMILEENINKDIYSNTDIESAAMRRLPIEERFSASTPRIYRLMSKYLKVGKLQSSPKMWEHRAKKLGSSFAKEMADVADVALEYAGIGEEEWNLPKRAEESSIVSRFFNKDYTAYARNVQEYDEEMKELEQAYTSYKKNPKGADEEKKKKAGLYNAIKTQDQQRVKLISDNQKLLSALRRKGYSYWQDYTDGKITKEQFKKEKELESAKVAGKYYANQKKISDITDKLLSTVRKEKKKKGIK